MEKGKYDIKIERIEESRFKNTELSDLKFGQNLSDHMFTADYIDGKWQNLRISPFENISISPANSALHYGQSIFEGMKAFKNGDDVLLFRPEMNAERLNKSAERMCMQPIPEDLFITAIKELLKVDRDLIPSSEGSSMYVRPFMFAADNALGVRPSESYRFMVITSPSGPYYAEPVRVRIETEFTRAAKGGTGAAKTAGNYAASLYPAQKAKKDGFDQVIWTDGATHSYVEEAGTMNLMFLIDGVLRTCPLTSTILPGVTRDSVLEYVKQKGIEVDETPLPVKEVIDAAKSGKLQEAFGVGTAVTVAPIYEIGYKDEVFALPELNGDMLHADIKNYLEALKRGEVKDENGWIVKC